MASRTRDAGPVATPAGLALRVVVTAERVPVATNGVPAAASAQARCVGVRLLIARARPRPGSTADRAITRHVAVHAYDGLLWRGSVAQTMLRDGRVDLDIVRPQRGINRCRTRAVGRRTPPCRSPAGCTLSAARPDPAARQELPERAGSRSGAAPLPTDRKVMS